MKSVYSRFISYCDNNKKNGNDIDFWRDTNVRYLGYANEVGEAIGPISASLMCNSFGFRASEDFIGGSCIIYVVLFICLCGGIKIFTQPPKESAEVLE